MNKIRFILFFCFIIGMTTTSYSQKGWEAGAWIGGSLYLGDLNTNFRLNNIGYALGLNGRYNFNERVSARLALNYARISGDDKSSPNEIERIRNLDFHSSLVEMNTHIEFNFLPYIHGSEDLFFTPYIAAGASVFYYNPKTALNGTTYSLNNYATEDRAYSNFNMAISFGGGFKWDLNEEWSINIEVATRRVFTDYLDDVSTVYPYTQTPIGERTDIWHQLSDRSVNGMELNRQRGNSRDNDSYNFIGISFMKYFGSLECPRISDY